MAAKHTKIGQFTVEFATSASAKAIEATRRRLRRRGSVTSTPVPESTWEEISQITDEFYRGNVPGKEMGVDEFAKRMDILSQPLAKSDSLKSEPA